uniref:GIY-YIG nuclease family protein n=1 Tax=Ditylenchus dipsaci TaxID=166011 RepID=A0A915DKC3_9BILA
MPMFSGNHRDACRGFSLEVVRNTENGPNIHLTTIQWKMEKFIDVYKRQPWHPSIQSILNAQPQCQNAAVKNFNDLFPGESPSYGTAYVIVNVPNHRESKSSIIYCGITGDEAESESQAATQWSSRMKMHSISNLFRNFNEIQFYKVLERASSKSIRNWEWATTYAKNMIDTTVRHHLLDRPFNDNYYLDLRNQEYPVNIQSQN